jgi:hypothetical protein
MSFPKNNKTREPISGRTMIHAARPGVKAAVRESGDIVSASTG